MSLRKGSDEWVRNTWIVPVYLYRIADTFVTKVTDFIKLGKQNKKTGLVFLVKGYLL
jgi:hypothetical protein